MSDSMVWVNGKFVGGWPYGYASYRLDLSEYLLPGEQNVVAVRLDNPVPADAQWDSGSSRWYPGAGIYRNVWLVTTEPVHVAQWGTTVTTPEVSEASAAVKLQVTVDNDTDRDVTVSVATDVFELDANGQRAATASLTLPPAELQIPAAGAATTESSGTVMSPQLWGTPPTQTPNLYVAVTRVLQAGEVVDVYETRFGIRSIEFDPDNGFFLNGEHVKMQGVCLHHDLGALGAGFNTRARQRQFEIMAEMGSNALRTAHNPPEPECSTWPIAWPSWS